MEIKKHGTVLGLKAQCQGCFVTEAKKYQNSPILPLGSLEVFICGESGPKFQM